MKKKKLKRKVTDLQDKLDDQTIALNDIKYFVEHAHGVPVAKIFCAIRETAIAGLSK